MTAPTNAQIDMLLTRLHEECYSDTAFGDRVIGDQSTPRLRLCARRATAPPGLASFDQLKVRDTLGNTPSCNATLTCALTSCRVLFATARMVAYRQKLLLGAAVGKQQTRFAFSFVDEVSRHNIPVGLHLTTPFEVYVRVLSIHLPAMLCAFEPRHSVLSQALMLRDQTVS